MSKGLIWDKWMWFVSDFFSTIKLSTIECFMLSLLSLSFFSLSICFIVENKCNYGQCSLFDFIVELFFSLIVSLTIHNTYKYDQQVMKKEFITHNLIGCDPMKFNEFFAFWIVNLFFQHNSAGRFNRRYKQRVKRLSWTNVYEM